MNSGVPQGSILSPTLYLACPTSLENIAGVPSDLRGIFCVAYGNWITEVASDIRGISHVISFAKVSRTQGEYHVRCLGI